MCFPEEGGAHLDLLDGDGGGGEGGGAAAGGEELEAERDEALRGRLRGGEGSSEAIGELGQRSAVAAGVPPAD